MVCRFYAGVGLWKTPKFRASRGRIAVFCFFSFNHYCFYRGQSFGTWVLVILIIPILIPKPLILHWVGKARDVDSGALWLNPQMSPQRNHRENCFNLKATICAERSNVKTGRSRIACLSMRICSCLYTCNACLESSATLISELISEGRHFH